MKVRGGHYLLGFLSFIAAIGIACSLVTGSPTSVPQPTTAPAATPVPPTQPPATPAGSTQAAVTEASNSSALVTFTDKNNYFSIDLPGDWTHKSGTDTNLYWDRFEAPDQHAFIENVAYDDGTPWSGGANGRGALALLNSTYSSTGKEGDIRVTDDSIQKDGSERLTWTSKGGGYSGVSFFEIRHRTTFLMFTLWWDNGYEEAYRQIVDDVIHSYRSP